MGSADAFAELRHPTHGRCDSIVDEIRAVHGTIARNSFAISIVAKVECVSETA